MNPNIRNAIVRNTGPRGPRFYEDGGKLHFVNVVDASTRDGPREATDADQEAFADAYAAFRRGHSGDSFPGAKPMITFSGEPPAELSRKAPLAVAPPEYVPPPEPEAETEAPKREKLHLKTQA